MIPFGTAYRRVASKLRNYNTNTSTFLVEKLEGLPLVCAGFYGRSAFIEVFQMYSSLKAGIKRLRRCQKPVTKEYSERIYLPDVGPVSSSHSMTIPINDRRF